MRILLALIITLLLAFSIYAQTPEPTEDNTLQKYSVEICWGTITGNSVWTPIANFQWGIATGNVGTHKNNGRLGIQTWEADVTVDPLIPLRLIGTFNLIATDIPNDEYKFHFYRIQIKSFLVDKITGLPVGESAISTISDWVVIHQAKPTGKPVKTN